MAPRTPPIAAATAPRGSGSLRFRCALSALFWLIAAVAAVPLARAEGTPPLLPEPTPRSDIDPALAELASRLDDLASGSIPADVPVAQLFSVTLDDAAAVTRRRDELQVEVQDLEQRASQLERDLATPAPVPPPELSAPRAPEVAPPEGSTDASSSEDAAATDTTPSAATTPEVESPLEAAELEAARLQEREALQEAYEQRRGEWAARIESTRRELQLIELRRHISSRRLEFLSALANRLEAMPAASRNVLRSLDQPRSALREHASDLRALATAAAVLGTEIELLGASAGRGALVGFIGDRRYLEERLPAESASLQQRSPGPDRARG